MKREKGGRREREDGLRLMEDEGGQGTRKKGKREEKDGGREEGGGRREEGGGRIVRRFGEGA
eukprot:748350-Rhodomonas_salina.1